MSLLKPASTSANRLKMLVYGKAGTGKTITGISFPSPAVVDGEKGTTHYGKYKSFLRLETRDVNDLEKVIDELLKDPAGVKSFVIDPFNVFYDDIQNKIESRLKMKNNNPNYTLTGLDYRAVNARVKQLINKLLSLDLNIIVTTKESIEYSSEPGKFMQAIGVRPEGPKDLPHHFDVVLHLTKNADGKFWAEVEKDRTNTLPPQFEYSYASFAKYMDVTDLEREPVILSQVKALDENMGRKCKIKFDNKEIYTAGIIASSLQTLKDLTDKLGRDVVLKKLTEDYSVDSFLDLRDDEATLLINELTDKG